MIVNCYKLLSNTTVVTQRNDSASVKTPKKHTNKVTYVSNEIDRTVFHNRRASLWRLLFNASKQYLYSYCLQLIKDDPRSLRTVCTSYQHGR